MTRWFVVPLLMLVHLFHPLIPQRFWDWLERTTPPVPPAPAPEEWFEVAFDEENIHLDVKPPATARQESIPWRRIERICYRVDEMGASDGIYLFLAQRAESVAIPVEAKGGDHLWQEILRRGLFDPELAIRVATSIEGVYCWPRAE